MRLVLQRCLAPLRSFGRAMDSAVSRNFTFQYQPRITKRHQRYSHIFRQIFTSSNQSPDFRPVCTALRTTRQRIRVFPMFFASVVFLLGAPPALLRYSVLQRFFAGWAFFVGLLAVLRALLTL